MKKVLLGIMALSMTAFAVNPGEGDPSTGEVASVPVKVKAEIIKSPTGITITDEAGTVLDQLLLDHGRMIKGQAAEDSKVYEIFKVKRFDEDGNSTDIGSGTVKVELDNLEAKLAKDGDTALSSLLSNLALLGNGKYDSAKSYTETITTGKTEVVGRVTSTIAQSQLLANTELGIFHNGGLNTLTITYTP